MHILIADRRGNEVRRVARVPNDLKVSEWASEMHEAVCGQLYSGNVIHRFLIADRRGRQVGAVPPIVLGGFEQMIRTGVEA